MKLYELNYEKEDILKKRREVIDKFLKKSVNIKNVDINALVPLDIKILFYIYDEVFFYGTFKKELIDKISFGTSKRMTKSAGLTIATKTMEGLKFQIRLGENFYVGFKNLYGNVVNGIEARNSLEALCIVLEHEICHVIEFYYFKTSSCKKPRFKAMAKAIFGHTKSYHEMLMVPKKSSGKCSFKVGQKVSFNYKGNLLNGIIYSINKRAAVMVKKSGGRYVDKCGNTYEKYYVPIDMLKGAD